MEAVRDGALRAAKVLGPHLVMFLHSRLCLHAVVPKPASGAVVDPDEPDSIKEVRSVGGGEAAICQRVGQHGGRLGLGMGRLS
jgi:hypothetical protein